MTTVHARPTAPGCGLRQCRRADAGLHRLACAPAIRIPSRGPCSGGRTCYAFWLQGRRDVRLGSSRERSRCRVDLGVACLDQVKELICVDLVCLAKAWQLAAVPPGLLRSRQHAPRRCVLCSIACSPIFESAGPSNSVGHCCAHWLTLAGRQNLIPCTEAAFSLQQKTPCGCV